ncbi:BlaI/MecI/CopY family transcriptional regulator [Rubrivirga marina]|uniref:CopY family transcriptional regulator n=1 Tax=Rubrivirga marina TaxID=1196024 RepID=A0A271J5C5_9BACT|nr:BlaI/MecI/CopY family transcriptional regulator [Rubrivirga marina]PAP78165.1 CopY family transcriptional regulator [Rubrivirga marina]
MPVPSLSRRERQVLDVLHRLGRASAADVREALPDPPSDSAVRTHLRILEEKGHVHHEQDGPRYVYLPVVESEEAGRSALRHLVRTFFDGTPERAVAALLDDASSELSDDDLDRLDDLIQRARAQGR